MPEHAFKFKLLDSLYEMAVNRKSELPICHCNDVHNFLPAENDKSLKKEASAFSDINLLAVETFIQRLSNDKRVKLAAIAVMKDGKLIAEQYVSPYTNKYRHVSYSMCKSVMSMAVGIAVSEGLFSVQDKICDLFPEYTGLLTRKWMKEITVEHLLTMTAGVKFDEFSSYFADDWCKAFIGSDVSFEPGSDFAYNSLNTYMLAAIITKKAGCSVMEYLQSRLFDPLGITDITWDHCPRDIECGGWGMKLSLQDMIKLGKLYLDQGAVTVDGVRKQLVPKQWIADSIQPKVTFRKSKVVSGYGYHIWCLKDGAFLFNGVFGQNVYVNREKNLVIACFAGGYEIFPEGHLVAEICRFVSNPENFERHIMGAIKNRVDRQIKNMVQIYADRKHDKKAVMNGLHDLKPYMDKTFCINGYASSILPTANQVVYSAYMTGMEKMRLTYKNNSLILYIRDSGKVYTLRAGIYNTHPYCYQLLDFKGKKMPAAVGCEIQSDGLGRCILTVRINYLEEVADKILKLRFEKNRVHIQTFDTPNMAIFLNKLSGEKVMQRTKKLGKLQKSGFLNSKLKKVLFPSCEGMVR